MIPTQFELQIEFFTTNNDSWEDLETFWCVFNRGYFRDTSTGNCVEWKDSYYHIGKVEKNQYNSYDLISSIGSNVYKSQEEALKAIENK